MRLYCLQTPVDRFSRDEAHLFCLIDREEKSDDEILELIAYVQAPLNANSDVRSKFWPEPTAILHIYHTLCMLWRVCALSLHCSTLSLEPTSHVLAPKV